MYNEIFYKFKFRVFHSQHEFYWYWICMISKNNKCDNEMINESKNNEMLKYAKATNILVFVSNDRLDHLAGSFNSLYYYQTIEFVLNYIKLNDDIAVNLMFSVLFCLTIPTTKEQQNSQFKIIKKLIIYPKAMIYLNDNLYFVFKSLNIPLVDFCIKEFDIKINELIDGYSVLHILMKYVYKHTNKNNELVYEMLEYLLKSGADIKTRVNFDFYCYVKCLNNTTIKNKLIEITKIHLFTGQFGN